MSVDPNQMQQPAGMHPSTPNGSVAPPQGVQGQAVSPGAGVPQQGQPAQPPQQPVAPGVQSTQPPVPSPGIDIQRVRAQEQELAQLRQAFGQIQQYAQQNQANQQLENELTRIAAHAELLPSGEANTYLRNSMRQLIGQRDLANQQQVQQMAQAFDQERKILASNPYADYLAKEHGLSDDAKQELLALGDPDLMHRQAPFIKQRYDNWNAQIESLRNGQIQNARTQEVMAATDAGLGAFGGQNGGSFQIEIDDSLDPDEKALAKLAAMEGRPGNYRRL